MIRTFYAMLIPSLLLGACAATVCGLAGIVYCAIVVRRTKRQTMYQPVWEDWLWHVLLPAASYVALALTALVGLSGSHVAGFLVAWILGRTHHLSPPVETRLPDTGRPTVYRYRRTPSIYDD